MPSPAFSAVLSGMLVLTLLTPSTAAASSDATVHFTPPYAEMSHDVWCAYRHWPRTGVCLQEEASASAATGAFTYAVEGGGYTCFPWAAATSCSVAAGALMVDASATAEIEHDLVPPWTDSVVYTARAEFSEQSGYGIAEDFYTMVEVVADGTCGNLDENGEPIPETLVSCSTSGRQTIESPVIVHPAGSKSTISHHVVLAAPVGTVVIGPVTVGVTVRAAASTGANYEYQGISGAGTITSITAEPESGAPH